MPESTNKRYHLRRERTERALANAAVGGPASIIHHMLADRYATLAADAETAAPVAGDRALSPAAKQP